MSDKKKLLIMKNILKKLYDYQWELTLTGAQLDEKVLRCHCTAETEAAIRSQCRSLLITASDIKYELLSIEQTLEESEKVKNNQEETTEIIKESFQQMERSLFYIIKSYVNLMAIIEEQPGEEEAVDLLKQYWPKLAEIYQFYKTSLIHIEEEKYQ